MNKLKPCPFCGGKAVIEKFDIIYKVVCQKCFVNIVGCSEKEVVAAWNKRTIPQELVDKIRKTYKEYFKNGLHYHNVG